MKKIKRTGNEKGRFNYCKKLCIYKEQHETLAKELLQTKKDYFGFAREIIKARNLGIKIDKLLHLIPFHQSTDFEMVMEEINSITRQNLTKEVEIETILKSVVAY